jgi:hypothetical protein
MAITGNGHGPDFADVYREQLLPVWRYVRSRVPDRHEAEDVAYGLHGLSLITAPLVALVLWRHFQRHRVQLGVVVGGVGAAMLVAHLAGHIVVPVGVPDWSVVADRLGTTLLLAGTVIDAIALNRWVVSQRERLAVAAADFRLAPA